MGPSTTHASSDLPGTANATGGPRSGFFWASLGRLSLLLVMLAWAAPAATISNAAFQVDSNLDGSVSVTETATGVSAVFQPRFRIMYSSASPGFDFNTSEVKVTEYGAAGFYPMVWNNDPDFFNAPGSNYVVSAWTNQFETGSFHWRFDLTNGIGVDARITVPSGSGEPLLAFELTAANAGYYTLGYVGIPERTASQVSWIWQPLFWTDKRIPSLSFLTPEAQCTLPAVLTGYGNQTVGLAIDPSDIYSPYTDSSKRVLDTTSNLPGNYGLALRNEAGNLQPMVFAPVYGNSTLAAGAKVTLSARMIVRQGAWYDNYKQLASALYSFSDYRSNALCSLNTTIDNMVDYMQGPYGHWLPRWKVWDYVNDKPGWGRQQSSADALSLAIVRDDLSFFTNIARPTVEYMLSRSGALFPLSDTNDPPNSDMGGWIGDTYDYGGTDFTSAYLLSGRRCTVLYSRVQPTLRTSALTGASNIGSMKDAIADLLSNYRLTGNISYLNAAKTTATNYIALRFSQPPTGKADAEGGFFTQLGSAWQWMHEMYDETGDSVYRDAFVQGMREFTAFTFLSPPSVPGSIQVSNYLTGQLESIPAWRVDPRGMMREAAATMHSHVGIHMPPFASYMLRAGYYTNDAFLRSIGRSAVIGRYASYPGYAYRRRLSHSFGLPDWPLQDYSVIRNYITMHFNHPLPMATYLIEYLAADAEARSQGQIRFPSTHSWTGAYFNHKVYGASPGSFYGDAGVYMWLPRSLVTNSSVQVNYLAGYGNGNLYVALMNEAPAPVSTQISINSIRVGVGGTRSVKMVADNSILPAGTMTNGTLNVSLSPMGITALVISNVTVTKPLHDICYEPSPVPLPTSAFQTRSSTPVGNVSGQILSFGTKLTSAYVAISYDINNIVEATLRYETNGVWNSMVKPEFPFEFTVPLADSATSFRFYVEGRTPAGAVVSNSPVQLGYQLTIEAPQGPGSAPTSALYNFNQFVVASVPYSVTTNGFRHTCIGWSMTGNSPASGTTNSVSLSLTNDAVLVWQWETVPLPDINNAQGASSITMTGAVLNAFLSSTGRASASVIFYWGPLDGGSNPASWAFSSHMGVRSSGLVSLPVTGLQSNSLYFYRASVTNLDGVFLAPHAASFVTAASNSIPGGTPGYRMRVEFPAYTRPEVLENFPVLITLNSNRAGFSYSQFLSPGGYDLRFKNGSQTSFLNYEIARWDTNGTSYVWVQVPEFSSNASVYASWGNTQNRVPYTSLTDGSTWSNGYEAVWHLLESPGVGGEIRDSSGKGNHGVANNLVEMDQVHGLAGGAIEFDGNAKFISLNSELVLPTNSAFTLSAWARPKGTTLYPGVTAPSTSPGYNNSLRLFSDSKPRFNINGGSKLFNTVTPKDGATWTYLAVARAAGSPGVLTLYQNASNDTGTATSTAAAFPVAFLGRGMETNDTARNWNGSLAEIRISSVARSANWLWAEYLGMASNSVLTSYAAVEEVPPLSLTISQQGGFVVLTWFSSPGAVYDLESTTNLALGFQAAITNIAATPPTNRLTNSTPVNGESFYRVKSGDNND